MHVCSSVRPDARSKRNVAGDESNRVELRHSSDAVFLMEQTPKLSVLCGCPPDGCGQNILDPETRYRPCRCQSC